jgi:hypothetical protein
MLINNYVHLSINIMCHFPGGAGHLRRGRIISASAARAPAAPAIDTSSSSSSSSSSTTGPQAVVLRVENSEQRVTLLMEEPSESLGTNTPEASTSRKAATKSDTGTSSSSLTSVPSTVVLRRNAGNAGSNSGQQAQQLQLEPQAGSGQQPQALAEELAVSPPQEVKVNGDDPPQNINEPPHDRDDDDVPNPQKNDVLTVTGNTTNSTSLITNGTDPKNITAIEMEEAQKEAEGILKPSIL